MNNQSGQERTVGDLAQEILDRLVADPQFKQMLLDDPAKILAETGYPVSDEVSGYGIHRQQMAMMEVTTAISCPPGCQIGKPPISTTPPAPSTSRADRAPSPGVEGPGRPASS